jgi:electron transport complex protein RnfG
VRDLIKSTLSLTIICVVVSAALGFTYTGTKAAIDGRARLDAENARKEVFADADKFEEIGDVADIVNGKAELEAVTEAFKALRGSETVGYVFTTSGKGYGGTIKIAVGIDTAGKITGMKIVEHAETPGLGSKAGEEPFSSQFTGITPQEPLKVVKNAKTKPEEIDAISGATITSRAVVEAVQAAVDMAAELNKEGGSSK